MPQSSLGQLITITVEFDASTKQKKYTYIRARKDDTIAAIMGRRGHPELVHQVGVINHIRSRYTRLKKNQLLRIPGSVATGPTINVLADDPTPQTTGGYAKYDTIDVHGRKGLSRFLGYDPIVMDLPIQFEHFIGGDGKAIEKDIQALERMAGRGKFSGAAVGPPAVIRVSTTDNRGNVVPFLPPNYQWSQQNQTAPLWRITAIAWSNTNVLRAHGGGRVRQAAVLTLTEYTDLSLVERSATHRSSKRHTKPSSVERQDSAAAKQAQQQAARTV